MQKLLSAVLLLLAIHTHGQGPALWGMTNVGGANDRGTIFRIDLDGSDYQVVYSFDSINGAYPEGGLCLAPNGDLYGLANDGGSNGFGTVFRISPTTLVFQKVFDLTGSIGGSPWGSLLAASDGKMYGSGSAFGIRVDPATDEVTPIGSFSVNDVCIEGSDGLVYGTNAYGGGDGTLFRIDPATLDIEVLHSFDGDNGSTPYGRPCQAGNGRIYGLTYDGGANAKGVVYEYDPSTGIFTKFLDFSGPDGQSPWSGFINLGPDRLLAPLTLGGAFGGGGLMELQPSTGQTALVHSFTNSVDGSLLFGGIVRASDGSVYGMTTNGGNNYGTIYRYDPETAALTTLHAFSGGAGGAAPRGELFFLDGSAGLPARTHASAPWHMWPNPAQGGTTLALADDRLIGAPLQLRDAVGRLVWEGRAGGVTCSIPLPTQPGTYVLTGTAPGVRAQSRVLVY